MRVFPAALVLLLSTMEGEVTARKTAALCAALGVARRTLERWRSWWRDVLVHTRFWDAERARFMPPIAQANLPAGLLERFHATDFLTRFVQCLYFLGPLTVPAMNK
jgi:hypothetical protein